MNFEDLDLIAIKHGTDKATKHPLVVPAHAYTLQYKKFFERVRTDRLKFLEIGVGGGESIRTWLEYFPNAIVHGIDIVHGTNPWNTPGSSPDPRYTFTTGDQSCTTFLACFIVDCGTDWDIIIDDGGHYDKHIIRSFDALWPHVKPGGLYCIEDLACAFSPIFRNPEVMNPVTLLKELMAKTLQGETCSEMHFSKELAIFRKQ